jgi:beta-fructofuranosidase
MQRNFRTATTTNANMANWIHSARKLRDRLLADPHRPMYHITAPEGVCSTFDPNAALFWRGRYHLMCIVQKDPDATTTAARGHSWAHLSSKDLVHWRHHPLALEPGGVDEGIYSGGVFVDNNGVATITYWGLGKQAGICLATSSDDQLEQWTKSPANPVIRHIEQGIGISDDGVPYGAADPSAIWIHNGRYYMLTGNLAVLNKYGKEQGKSEHQSDRAYLFVSDDLARWEYLHPFYESDRAWTANDEDCMCPDFFALGDRHVLVFISHNRGCQYYIGHYRNDRFYPESHQRMSWVDRGFFAPESLLDERGRRIMWAWIGDGRDAQTQETSMWSGTMSLPRVLWLGHDRTLRMAPPEELACLRCNPRTIGGVVLNTEDELALEQVAGNTIELQVEMTSDSAKAYGVTVCCSPAREEHTRVFYDAADRQLKIDTTHSSLGEGSKSIESGPLDLEQGESLRMRIFVDRSVVEVFANDRQAVMRRIYPTRADSLGVSLFSKGGPATARTIEAWDMAPSNPW